MQIKNNSKLPKKMLFLKIAFFTTMMFMLGCSNPPKHQVFLDYKFMLLEDENLENNEVLYGEIAQKLYDNSMFGECGITSSEKSNKTCVLFNARKVKSDYTITAEYKKPSDNNTTVKAIFPAYIFSCEGNRCARVIVGQTLSTSEISIHAGDDVNEISIEDIEEAIEKEAEADAEIISNVFSNRELLTISVDIRTMNDRFTPYKFLKESANYDSESN